MWLVCLSGDTDILSALNKRYSKAELKITYDDEKYWLSSCHLEEQKTGQGVYDTGEDLISFVNASSKLFSWRQDPVKSAGYHEQNENGELEYRFHAMHPEARIPLRLISISNDLPEEDFLGIYLEEERVRFVLSEYNREDLNWFSAFNIHEAIISDEEIRNGFESVKIAIDEWGGHLNNKRFLSAANWHRHSKLGRSGGRSSRAPKEPMKLVEAERFLREVIVGWLRYKAGLA